jgi:ATP-dependent DNA ligase
MLSHSVANGTDVFRMICDRDMEGIVAKQASAGYTPAATTWVKIKNREYSQAIGREDFFNRRKPGSGVLRSLT